MHGCRVSLRGRGGGGGGITYLLSWHSRCSWSSWDTWITLQHQQRQNKVSPQLARNTRLTDFQTTRSSTIRFHLGYWSVFDGMVSNCVSLDSAIAGSTQIDVRANNYRKSHIFSRSSRVASRALDASEAGETNLSRHSGQTRRTLQQQTKDH